MAQLVCEVCGFIRETPQTGEMLEQPEHCGQPMKIEEE